MQTSIKTKIKIKDNLKLKYYLGLHLRGGYSNNDSVLFELINYIISNNIENKDKNISYSNLKFSIKTLKYIFGEDILNDDFKNQIIFSIKELIKDKKIDVNKKYFHITEDGINTFYNINGKYK